MARPITIPNVFQNQTGNIPLSQLDTDFSTLATAINDPASYSNYAVDSGIVNAAIITLNPVPSSLVSLVGVPIQFKPVATSTGSTTINVNAFGAIAILRPDGTATQVGDLHIGVVATIVYNGTNYTIQGQVLGGTNTWQNPQRGTITTANTAAFDESVTNNFQCTPAATVALTFSNHTAGQSGYVLLINTGGYAITAAGTTKLGAATLATISVAGTYLLSYLDNGTNAYVTASGILA